ncbi:protein pigeon isoform X1 [Schistocerca gregaria]|uniref:protein pigeon isoform X1 n=2 Tax=Schistocerca gregaria TaxID=7010 RepID=UPI00211EA0D8|nr:protein pigeon isoform X1 [Schistocerca gregaria]
MVAVENLGRILSDLFQRKGKGTVREWKPLGQEQDGCLIIGWWLELQTEDENCHKLQTYIGKYYYEGNSLKVLYIINSLVNVVQASVNASDTLLGYVIKKKVPASVDIAEPDGGNEVSELYEPFLVEISEDEERYPKAIGREDTHQTMVQFLYRKKGATAPEKLLMLIHQDSISLHHVQLTRNDKDQWTLNGDPPYESIVKTFCWAQWDCVHQSLYYIHYRKPQISVEGEEKEENQEEEMSPTLSCLQFHDEMPHETVLNIPLNLPQLPKSVDLPCDFYEDDPIPLRIHDCSLDLQVITDPKGIICICHHYLYQPVKAPVLDTGSSEELMATVHFAYSVTLLHHGSVIHCVVPGILWSQARSMKPTFMLHGDHHMLVFAPGLFAHLLDIGLSHEPCCHVLAGPALPGVPGHVAQLVPLLPHCESAITLDLPSLDLVPLSMPPSHLFEAFRDAAAAESTDDCLAILHYFLVHVGDSDAVSQLLKTFLEKPLRLNVSQILQEMLVGGAYASSYRTITSDALPLLGLLPLTTISRITNIEVKINRLTMSISQETLWNTAMMLLSPQQRLVPYRVDLWTKLWDHLAKRNEKDKRRFSSSQVAEKLMVSLVCYQPEALSRSSTPLSPGASLVGSGAIADMAAIAGNRKGGFADMLPFCEVESCTASKQEHVISVNLRELSMHLLKNGSRQTPMNVHIVATRYVAAQLEVSKHLCAMLCQCAGIDSYKEQEKGFALIDQLDEDRRNVMFVLLERYYYAIESLAFPLPQGFTSFFTYLGYRTLSFSMFLQYLQRSVFELQIDVMKAIMADTDDSKEGVKRKLRLLLFLPRSRAKRLLNQWTHPASLMLRAREHALNILSGVEGAQARGHPSQRTKNIQLGSKGLAAFPSADRLSPLDTFLNLLTAKANLNELDFGLLVEATVTSTEDFL